MELSIFFARLFGLYLVIVCFAVLVNRRMAVAIATEISSSVSALLFSGTILLILGLSVVLSHNIWTADWRALITLFGWLTVAKGIIRLFFPQKALTWGSRIASGGAAYTTLVVVFLCMGLYLTFIGFYGA